jgi:hypothetical protein
MHGIRFIILACLLLICLSTTACKVGDPATYPPPPPRNCATADECFSIYKVLNNACQFPAPHYETRYFYQAFNFHSSKNIIAVILVRVMHLQYDGTPTTLPNPPYNYIPVRLLAQPKGIIHGGPSGIDLGGPSQDLVCEYTKQNDYVDDNIYTPYRACFEDDTTCINQLPPAPSGGDIARCETECNKPGGMCTTANVGKSPQLSSFAGSLIGGQLPTTHDLQSIANLLGVGPACASGGMIIDANGSVISSGSQCTVSIPLSDTAPWSMALLDIPSVTVGDLTRIPPPKLEATIFWRPNAAIIARTYTDPKSPPASEPLWALRARPNKLLFATQHSFCAKITFTE